MFSGENIDTCFLSTGVEWGINHGNKCQENQRGFYLFMYIQLKLLLIKFSNNYTQCRDKWVKYNALFLQVVI